MRAARLLPLLIALPFLLSTRAADADRYLNRPSEWFGTEEARQIGRNILSWQTRNGDWPKNTDTVSRPRPHDAPASRGTFDNGATVGELRLIAKIYSATRDEELHSAFLKGLRLILDAQYENGGWPQSSPPSTGYPRHITFNDNTFVRLADFVHDIGMLNEFSFVERPLRDRARGAYFRAIECVVRAQVRIDGVLTVWCAQHDELTLEPRPARTYELVSLSGSESAGLLRFLMRVDQPDAEVRAAIEAGMKWFDAVKLTGFRQVRENGDKKLIPDETAPPLWARFYEIGTNRPIFSGRDGAKKYSIAEIETERRNGYAWYGEWGSTLAEPYREWRNRIALAAPEPAVAARLQKLGKRDVRVHDPSTIVQENDEFWFFYTGRGTPSYRSKDLKTWSSGPRVFTNAPAWIKETVPQNRGGMDFWAPDVIAVDGRYLLYYSVSTFGRNTSAIGLAVNKTLDPEKPEYQWLDQGIVVQSSTNSNFNAIDPAIARDTEGGLWMSFGSFWDGIKLIELDPGTGKRKAETPMYSLARHPSIEAPFIYHHAGFYYLMVNWGRCCRGTNSTYNVRVGRSETIIGPYRDREGKSMADGGGTLLLETDGAFIGPGHAGILKLGESFWMSLHFYDATQRGRSSLAIRPLIWNADGWPAVLENE